MTCDSQYLKAIGFVAVGVGLGLGISVGYQRCAWKHGSHRMIPNGLLSSAYAKELKIAVECALLAGKHMIDALDVDNMEVSSKAADSIDFVTAVDISNERIIFNSLREAFPDHSFIGEESSGGAVSPVSERPTWIVDPIDGTTNFLHRNPNACVSIGLVVDRKAVLGVVYAPCFEELYVCIKGSGAFLNGRRIAVTQAFQIKDALIETNIGYTRSVDSARRIGQCVSALLLARCHGLREMGSSVLSLCYLAAGRLDAVYGGVAGDGGYPWDYCAAALMVAEAGGVVSDVAGNAYNVDSRSVLAASTCELHNEIASVIHAQN